MHRSSDPKIDRLRDSFPGLSHDDATWLARVADEVHAATGTVLGARHFAHVLLDGADAGTVVAPGARPHVLRHATRVLVLRGADAAMMQARLAAVRTGATNASTTATPVAVA